MRKTHIGTALILIPLGLWCLFWLLPNNTVPPTSEDDLSPGFVPAIALGTIVVTGLMMLLQALRQTNTSANAKANTNGHDDEEFGKEATGINVQVLLNVLFLTILSVITWLLIVHVGFEPAMTVVLMTTMLYVGVRNPLVIGVTAVLMPIVLSMCAWYFFSTEMPGIWR